MAQPAFIPGRPVSCSLSTLLIDQVIFHSKVSEVFYNLDECGKLELVLERNVLELGSGVGFLGIIIASLQVLFARVPSAIKYSIWLTDINDFVLSRCLENTSLPCSKYQIPVYHLTLPTHCQIFPFNIPIFDTSFSTGTPPSWSHKNQNIATPKT